jgi:hypothetical protein
MTENIGCVILLVNLALLPFAYLLDGWVLSKLWGWYIAPLGLPSLTIPMAIGVAIVVGYLTSGISTKPCKDNRSKEEKIEDSLTATAAVFAKPFLALGVGWIVFQFVG